MAASCSRPTAVDFSLILLSLAGIKKKKTNTAPASSPLAFIKADPSLSTFAAAVKAANLTSKLDNPETVLTVFAPTNAAFDSYLAKTKLTKSELLSSPDLKYIIKQHVVKGNTGVKSSAWTQGQALKSWLSETAPIVVSKEGDKVSVSSAGAKPAALVKLDQPAGAGVVHVIDAVLSPPTAVVDAVKAAAVPAVPKAAVASVAGRKLLMV